MPDAPAPNPADEALRALLRRLDDYGYEFVAPTPATQRRLLRRRAGETASTLRDALGWSLPFRPGDLPPEIVGLLETAGLLERAGEFWKSAVRVSRVRGLLFLHSAFPTTAEDAVFLGPDSYRFADFVAAELAGRSWAGRIVDIGAGAGVGALTAARGRGRSRVLLTDLNPKALRLARVNADHAGVAVETFEGSGLQGVEGEADLIVANPPYIAGDPDQTYKDGGDMHGGRISLDWTQAALDRLAPGGRFLLYTGSAIVDGGRDELREALERAAEAAGVAMRYRELDPDIFGEELKKPAYADVERIAAVGAVFTKPRSPSEQS